MRSRVLPGGIGLLAGALVLLVGATPATASAAPTITEYSSGLSNTADPLGIASAPNGNLWFTQNGADAIGTITPAGTISRVMSANPQAPLDIAQGPDGKLWFTELGGSGNIGTIDPQTNAVSEYGLPGGGSPIGIVGGPEGDVWFTESGGNAKIGRINPSTHQIKEFAVPVKTSQPAEITVGPEGDLWFTESHDPGAIGRLDPKSGTFTQFTAGLTVNATPWGIATGPEGNIWFTESSNPGRIGRIVPSTGTITEFSTGLTVGSPEQIAAGSDGNLYFTESNGRGALAKITPAGAITEYTQGLSSNGGPWGIASGPDGNIWFTETANPAKIGRLTVAPSVAAPAAGSVGVQTATLKATVGANAQATSYLFEYGPTTSYGSRTSTAAAGSSSTPVSVSSALSGLAAGQTYHFRILASNATGTTTGTDATFTTDTPPAPGVSEETASEISASGASLGAVVNPQGQASTYHFEWGTSTAYGAQAPSPDESTGASTGEDTVSLVLAKLLPATTYHYRIVVSDCGGCAAGTTAAADETFTTSPASETPATSAPVGVQSLTSTAGLPPLTQPLTSGLPLNPGLPAPLPPAVIGRSATVQTVSGTVLVRAPSGALVALGAGGSIPMGSVVDASHGTLRLVTALDTHGATQSALVWAGVFKVAQGSSGNGMTELMMARASSCAVPRRGRASSASARHAKKNTLWAEDNHGRYSTHGANSVATVLGTKWETTESCAGTLTRVVRGRVRVRDLSRHKTVVVSAGHSHLAPS